MNFSIGSANVVTQGKHMALALRDQESLAFRCPGKPATNHATRTRQQDPLDHVAFGAETTRTTALIRDCQGMNGWSLSRPAGVKTVSDAKNQQYC